MNSLESPNNESDNDDPKSAFERFINHELNLEVLETRQDFAGKDRFMVLERKC